MKIKIECKLNRVELIKFYDYLSDSNVIRDEEKGKAFRWIDNFKNRKRTSKMKVVRLECVLMDNKEIIFCGRSLGFVTDEEIENISERYSKDDVRKYEDGWWITSYVESRKERLKLVGCFETKQLAENAREILNASQLKK